MLPFIFSCRSDRSLKHLNLLSDEDLHALRSQGIESPGEFYARMARTPTLIDSIGLPDEKAKRRVVEAMSTLAGERAESITGRPLIKHIADVIVVIAVCLVTYALFFVDRAPVKSDIARQVVVTAPHGLQPFRVIKRGDVEIRSAVKSANAAVSLEAVVGRYTTEPLAEGAIINQAKLNVGPRLSNELDELQVFAVTLAPTPLLLDLKIPLRVGIMPSLREKSVGSPPEPYDVYILQVRPLAEKMSAVIATSKANTRALVPFLSHADLIVVGPAR